LPRVERVKRMSTLYIHSTVNITLDGEGVEGGPMGAEHLLLAAQAVSTPPPPPTERTLGRGGGVGDPI
jgi:hypothetical protein